MEAKSICIFCPTGRTFTFRNVKITCDNETVLAFEYLAMSDGQSKTATVLKQNIVAWSILK